MPRRAETRHYGLSGAQVDHVGSCPHGPADRSLRCPGTRPRPSTTQRRCSASCSTWRGRTVDAQERIAALEPKAEALARLEDAAGLLSITHAAKQLGVRPGRLFDWLEEHRWLYRGADGLIAYQPRLDRGLLVHRSYRLVRKGKPDRFVPQPMLTAKGIARLAELRAGL